MTDDRRRGTEKMTDDGKDDRGPKTGDRGRMTDDRRGGPATRNPQRATRNSFAEVNLGHLLHNFRVLKSRLKPGVKMMCVVKADAYGHGSVPVARALEPVTDCFAVVNTEEAIELRKDGIKKEILVFGPPNPETAPAYRAWDLMVVVSDIDHFELLPEETRYHIEFDTGMGRLGIMPDQIHAVKEKIKAYPKLECRGVMTHFASADIPDQRARTMGQITLFEGIRREFSDMPDILFHAANTAGLLCYPEAAFDMVRPGLGLYGYGGSGLKPVMQWKSHISQCRPITKGSTVSYGAQWTAPVDGYLGVIPVGYADGFKRGLSGKAVVHIGQACYPVVGRVTMDFIMVFLGSRFVEPGTGVTLLGDKENTADDWADKTDTISYEILCGLHRRVERVYL